MPRASTIPTTTHNRTAPPLVQKEGGADAPFPETGSETGAGGGVESGDPPGAAAVGRVSIPATEGVGKSE